MLLFINASAFLDGLVMVVRYQTVLENQIAMTEVFVMAQIERHPYALIASKVGWDPNVTTLVLMAHKYPQIADSANASLVIQELAATVSAQGKGNAMRKGESASVITTQMKVTLGIIVRSRDVQVKMELVTGGEPVIQ